MLFRSAADVRAARRLLRGTSFDLPQIADEDAMGAFLDSEAWSRATWELSGRAFGIARLAARPFAVV